MQINGAALRTIRERTGESLTQLSRKTGISLPALSHFEAGRRNGTPEQIKKLAVVLDCPITAITVPEFAGDAA